MIIHKLLQRWVENTNIPYITAHSGHHQSHHYPQSFYGLKLAGSIGCYIYTYMYNTKWHHCWVCSSLEISFSDQKKGGTTLIKISASEYNWHVF